MNIPSHQIHNILNAYSIRLVRKEIRTGEIREEHPSFGMPQISESGKHHAIMRKVIADIFDKVSE